MASRRNCSSCRATTKTSLCLASSISDNVVVPSLFVDVRSQPCDNSPLHASFATPPLPVSYLRLRNDYGLSSHLAFGPFVRWLLDRRHHLPVDRHNGSAAECADA